LRLSVFHRNVCNKDSICICIENPDPSLPLDNVNQSFVDAEGPDSGGDVSTIATVNYSADINLDLGERVIYVCIVSFAFRYYRYLRCDRAGSPQAIDLENVGRPHQPLEQHVTLDTLFWKVIFMKI